MESQDFKLFLDGSSVGTFNTGASGVYDYTISGLSSGQHTLKAESTDGSAVNLVTFTEPCTVTYQAGSNGTLSGSSTESVDYSGKPSSPPTPVPDIGYSFSYWSSNGGTTQLSTAQLKLQTITADITYTAYFTQTPYTITYDGNSSDGGVPTDSNTYHYGDTVTVKSAGAMTKTGYTFNGWKDQDGNSYTATGAETLSMPAKNVTFTAQWTINSYTVTYDGNGNTSGAAPSDSSSPHDYDTQVVVLDNTNLAKTGYKFSGWNTKADGSGTSDITGDTFNTPADNVVLYAKWTLITYKVTYDSNAAGAAGSMEDSTHIYDTDKNLTLNGYKVTGYTFNGWNTEANGSGIAYTDGQSVVNLTIVDGDTITLYAQWTINSYTVTFNSNKGSSVSAQTVDYNDTIRSLLIRCV
jgi:uncharacterized repeat protein (TIGR02543 family)